MEFRNRGFPHNHLYRTPPTSSPSNYTNFSDHALERGMWSGSSMVGDQGRSGILLDLEKKRIREEIFAEEAARKRVLEAEIRRELMIREMSGMQSGGVGGGLPSSSLFLLGHPDSHHFYRSQPLHGQSFEPVDRRITLPFQEEYGGDSGRQPAGEFVGAFKRGPMIKEIITSAPKAGGAVFMGLGNPHVPTVSGAKRKPISSPASGGSAEISSSSKKKTKEWSCAICEVNATSERGLQDHLAGKKHKAKVAEMKADDTGKSEKQMINNSPESVQLDLIEDKKPEGESSGHKFKFWCRMCKTGASNKQEMNMHKKGVKHLKNQLNRAQKSRRKAGGVRGRI